MMYVQTAMGMREATIREVREHLAEYEWAMVKDTSLESPDEVRAFLVARLGDLEAEVFSAIYLDNRHRVIAFEELFRGTIDGASVWPREVVRAVMRHNAAAVIFAHNHPSGVSEPSAADTRITQRLREALKLIDVRVLDHIVVGLSESTSMAEQGLI